MISQMIEKERIEKELQIAKEIQQSFLIHDSLDVPGLDIAYVNVPSSAVGGDYYDIIPRKNDGVILTINDISGHGIPASLLMSIVRSNFVYSIRHDGNLMKTASFINNLVAETTETNLYVTSFMGFLDIKKKKLNYINAGHGSPILIRNRKVVSFPESSMVLGMFPDVDFEENEIPVRSGDLLMLYTDGVAEAEDPGGRELGEQGLRKLLKKHCTRDAETIKDLVIDTLKSHVGSEYFLDDVTFIVVKIG
jgi:sigma-B regulation protein RsbU (phosphoserine phosphatase)